MIHSLRPSVQHGKDKAMKRCLISLGFLIFPTLLLAFFLSGSTTHAQINTGGVARSTGLPAAAQGSQSPQDTDGELEIVTLTEEDRYNPVYYQKPEAAYPIQQDQKGRAGGLSLEDYVVDALEACQDEIDLSGYQLLRTEATQKYFQIVDAHPALFYIGSKVGWYTNKETGLVTKCRVYYSDTKENIKIQRKKFHREVDRALAWTDYSRMSDLEKALAAHDYLVLECEYDYQNYLDKTVPSVSHTAYGVLVEKTGVCDGYALAYSCILEELGVPVSMVVSNSMKHAWNLVSIGGSWYHVDVTWDDPVWDKIGYVRHRYFLLSDAALSGEGQREPHEGWESYGCLADSTAYDNAFWFSVTSAFCYQGGNWYYAKSNGDKTASLLKKPMLLEGQEEAIYTESTSWNNYRDSYLCLDLEPMQEEVYFNTRTSVCKLDGNGNIVEIYAPGLEGKNLMFGFTLRGEALCYALQETPSTGGRQVIEEHLLAELCLPQITWVSASDVEAVYDGTPKGIAVEGAKPGDTITYRAGVSYGAARPEWTEAGTYQVSYKAEREGHGDYFGSAWITIQKAEPSYTVPTGLKGNSGSTLGTVPLPEGFAWENAAQKLRQEGNISFYASYTPEDARNYKKVSRLALPVTVTCPGHQYTKKVTVKATAAQEGKETYTCGICGDAYSKIIPKLKPDGTGSTNSPGGTDGSGTTGGTGSSGNPTAPKKVSGLKLSKAAASSLKFSWKPANGAKYRIMLYQGSKKVSTKYTGGSSYTFKKLTSATLYTVKVASYVEKNGKKTYASSSAALKTATAPAKAKLSSVKKRGSGKVKLTWKKVLRADGYEISMRTGKGSYKAVKVIAKGKTTSYTKAGLKKGKSYTFRIRAYKKAGSKKIYGSYSSGKTLKLR